MRAAVVFGVLPSSSRTPRFDDLFAGGGGGRPLCRRRRTHATLSLFLHQRDFDAKNIVVARQSTTTTRPPGGGGLTSDEDEDDFVGTRTRATLEVKVADLKLELEKRNLKKYGKKQELVDRLLVELKRERESAMMTFVNDDENERTRGRENNSDRNNGEGANEDDDDNASRVNGFDGERDGEGEDMTAVNAAPPPSCLRLLV